MRIRFVKSVPTPILWNFGTRTKCLSLPLGSSEVRRLRWSAKTHLAERQRRKKLFTGLPMASSVTSFAEGEVGRPSDKYIGGKSTRGVGFYSAPCTPPNTMPHHYTFVLVASDFDPKELPPGLTRDEVIAKMAPDYAPPVHAKGDTGLVGLFVNP
jgi:hypothetical protein